MADQTLTKSSASQGDEGYVGKVIRRLRDRTGLSVRGLASKSGFSPSFISQVELGQASPSIASLEKIASALDVTLGEFFEKGIPDPPLDRKSIRKTGGS